MKKIFITLLAGLVALCAAAQSQIVTESILSDKLGCEQKYNVEIENEIKGKDYTDYQNFVLKGACKSRRFNDS